MLALALVLAIPGSAPGATADVRCGKDGRFSYALYLPRAFDEGRRWPILYVFDPRGRAGLGLDLFRQAAEAHGFIVASSYDTRSDEDAGPSLEAIEALWTDTHARLPLAAKRAYAAGFSGGARLACQLGAAAKGELQGVIAVGGSFPDPSAPPRNTPFAVFGIAGHTDFNYSEMRELAATLEPLGVPYHVANFAGGHAWPPPELAQEALDWLELQAVRRTLRDADPALAERVRESAAHKARGLEAAGDPAGALEIWEQAARDVAGLTDVAELRAAVARLSGRPEVKAERRRRKERDRADRAYQVKIRGVLSALSPPARLPSLRALARDLDVEAVKREAAEATGYTSLSAQRRLADLSALVAGYLPRGLLPRGEYARAARSYEVALLIRPENATLRYNLACALARAGAAQDALAALEQAVGAGFSDRAQLEQDADLESLRSEPRYRAVLARLP